MIAALSKMTDGYETKLCKISAESVVTLKKLTKKFYVKTSNVRLVFSSQNNEMAVDDKLRSGHPTAETSPTAARYFGNFWVPLRR